MIARQCVSRLEPYRVLCNMYAKYLWTCHSAVKATLYGIKRSDEVHIMLENIVEVEQNEHNIAFIVRQNKFTLFACICQMKSV